MSMLEKDLLVKFSLESKLLSFILKFKTNGSLSVKILILLQALFVLSILAVGYSSKTDKPPVTVTRTEIKVSRSLNPEDTQTLNVVTRDGGVAQLIVKRRDAKSKGDTNYQNLDNKDSTASSSFSRAVYTNWIPLSSVYYQPKIITLEKIALVRNASDKKPINNNLGNVIDSDR